MEIVENAALRPVPVVTGKVEEVLKISDGECRRYIRELNQQDQGPDRPQDGCHGGRPVKACCFRNTPAACLSSCGADPCGLVLFQLNRVRLAVARNEKCSSPCRAALNLVPSGCVIETIRPSAGTGQARDGSAVIRAAHERKRSVKYMPWFIRELISFDACMPGKRNVT
jgi:hypothetical protein